MQKYKQLSIFEIPASIKPGGINSWRHLPRLNTLPHSEMTLVSARLPDRQDRRTCRKVRSKPIKWSDDRERSAFNNEETGSFGAMEWGDGISKHLLNTKEKTRKRRTLQ